MLPPLRTVPAARGRCAAHRDRPESERGSYFNLRNGALGRVCPGRRWPGRGRERLHRARARPRRL